VSGQHSSFFQKDGLSQMQTRNKKKQTMLLYFLQEGPIADFIVLPSPLRTEM
jgi:hypothetical protein